MDRPSTGTRAPAVTDRPDVDVLVLLDEAAGAARVEPAVLAEELERRFPAGRWAVRLEPVGASVARGPGREAPRVSEALAEARARLLATGADLAVLVTGRPVVLHGRRVRSHTSPVQRCAVLTTGETGSRRPTVPDVAPDVAALVGELLDLTGGAQDREVLESVSDDDVPDQPAGPGVRRLLGEVVASRPWLLTLHLSRSLVGASAAAFLAIVTPDFWMLADRLSGLRLAAISVLVLLAGIVVLVVGGNLRERPGPARSRRRVRQHNAAVWLGVGLGVLSLFVVLVLASLAITLVVLPTPLVTGAIGHHAGWVTMARIGVVTAIVSLVGSVFGAGLEDDGDVREATFGGSDDVRYSDDAGR